MEFTRCYNCIEPLPAPGAVCPHCGYDNTNGPASQPTHVLPCGTILNGQYVVGRMLGQGGFGITYIGWDLNLEMRVCIKEYYPEGAAMRSAAQSSAIYWGNSENAQGLKQGRESFVKEARKAVKLRDLSHVVSAWGVFYENETAYIVMDYVEGKTLKSQLLQSQRTLSENECAELFMPVMTDLEKAHQRGIIHRDIKPDNLMLTPDGELVLLDMGAAKDLSGGSAQSSFMVASQGFSPIEQYMKAGEIGPWTDIYALCATMYYCVTGKLLPPPIERQNGETIDFSGLSPAFAKALEKGLALKAGDRFQTMGKLAAALEGVLTGDSQSAKKARPASAASAGGGQAKSAGSSRKGLLAALVAAALLAAGFFFWKSRPSALVAAPETTPPAATAAAETTPPTAVETTPEATAEPTAVEPTPEATPEPTPAAAWSLPDRTPMFEPGSVMETDFGTFTVQDAGFAKKVELFYTRNTRTVTTNGVTEKQELRNEIYYTAKDGTALFVVKGVLRNTSDTVVNTDKLRPEIRYGGDETIEMWPFPAVPLSGSLASPPGVPVDLQPGESVEIDYACAVSKPIYFGDADILLTFDDASLGFRKAGLASYVSMGFGDEDGEVTEDVTALIDEVRAAAAARKEEEAEAPHADELTVEDVAFEYDSKGQRYSFNAKVRNLNYPVMEGRSIASVRVHFRFLDANGDALSSNYTDIGGFEDLRTGQAGWGPYVLSGSGTHLYLDRATVDMAQSIMFDSYEIRYSAGSGGGSKTIKGTLTVPPVFRLDELLPNRADAQALSEADAIAVENVKVEFMDELPASVRNSSAYSAGISRFNYTLNDSEIYAAVSFTVTNLTKQDFFLADMSGDFAVELNFDDGFLYSTESNNVHFVQVGNQVSVVSHSGSSSSRIGEKSPLSPLVSADVTIYLPCAKLVSTQTDKPLLVSFHTTQTGNKQIDVKVR